MLLACMSQIRGNHHPKKNVLDAMFRANPLYTLLRIDQLASAERETFASLEQDEDFYGLLFPSGDKNLGVKAVDQETALLFFTLQTPGPVPRYVRRRFGERCSIAIADLIMAGILEIDPAGDGRFVSGAGAYEALYDQPANPTDYTIDPLSLDALRYGQSLSITGRQALSLRLYHYNTIPISAAWRQRLPDAEAVRHFLGLAAKGQTNATLSRYWSAVKNPDGDVWWQWQRRAPQSSEQVRFKLYISPRPDVLPDVWPAIVGALTAGSARSFKIGATVEALLRPDKIVAYCTSFEALTDSAGRLKQVLEGYPPQGVPFSAPIDDARLLSWGMDPPAEIGFAGWQARESWRLWITNRLAAALLDAKAQESDLAPWRFAIERLFLEGVDVQKWAPGQAMWQTARSV